MKKAFIILVVTMLTTYLLATDTTLSISPLGNGNWQIVASFIPNKLSHQTVYVLQSSTNCIAWTGVVTNRGLIPPWITNTAYSTNVATFYSCLLYTSPSQRDGLQSRMQS